MKSSDGMRRHISAGSFCKAGGTCVAVPCGQKYPQPPQNAQTRIILLHMVTPVNLLFSMMPSVNQPERQFKRIDLNMWSKIRASLLVSQTRAFKLLISETKSKNPALQVSACVFVRSYVYHHVLCSVFFFSLHVRNVKNVSKT